MTNQTNILQNSREVIIDVREPNEYTAEHIENSILIPLSEFPARAPAILKTLHDRPLVFMCRGGNRAKLAATQAQSLVQGLNLSVYEGGIMAWAQQGKPTVRNRRAGLPIIRQVQLVAGSMVVLGLVLAQTVSPSFIYLSGFVGMGLVFAGATGVCPMANLLAAMPWNTSRASTEKEVCDVSPESKSCCG
jgi:rhodanese-related sulfurtransferase